MSSAFNIGDVVRTIKGARFTGEIIAFDNDPKSPGCTVLATHPDFAGTKHVYPLKQIEVVPPAGYSLVTDGTTSREGDILRYQSNGAVGEITHHFRPSEPTSSAEQPAVAIGRDANVGQMIQRVMRVIDHCNHNETTVELAIKIVDGLLDLPAPEAERLDAATVEACAKVAEAQAVTWVNSEATIVFGQAFQRGCKSSAKAIRTLAGSAS